MIVGTGVDLIEIARMEKAMSRSGFAVRVFTEAERAYAAERRDRPEVYAGMFAAKEAVSKALGTGIAGFSIRDIEILHNERRAPYAVLHGGAREAFDSLAAKRVLISISHDQSTAVAFAVIEE